MNHYCDIWFWRASDQADVAQHLRDRDRTTGVPDTPRRAGLLRSALLSLLRMTGLAKQPVEARSETSRWIVASHASRTFLRAANVLSVPSEQSMRGTSSR